LHRPGGERAVHHAPGFLAPEESRLFENPHVLGETGERHREGLSEVADGGAARGQPLEDPAAGWVGKRRKESVEG